MVGIPERDEAAEYYYKYIDRITSPDIADVLEKQLEESLGFFAGISEEKSLYRYAPGKWSFRQVLSHINDTERVFLFRALWFGRGFDTPLPSFDENVSAETARGDEVSWDHHIEEFRAIRQATLSFFRNLPAEAWSRSGIASGSPISVRALAYITAGHLSHHLMILQERYL